MKICCRHGLVALAAFLALYYSPYLVDFRPKAYSIPFPAFEGPLAENYKLSEAEHLYKGQFTGPESTVFHEGYIYTGLEDGRIVKLKGGEVTTVAQTGRRCVLPYEERLCGRPLGFRKYQGLLYLVDAYFGIFSMNFTTGALDRILPSTVLVEGQELAFPDDLDIDREGNVYFSDASARWDLSTIYYLMTEYEGAGRIVRFNIHSGEAEVVARDLFFPNGVQLSRDQKSLLVSELSNRRILRLHVKGPKKGQVEVFADTLPGEPDNIRPSSRGYWVAFTSARNHTNTLFVDDLSDYPTVRYVWGRVHHLVGTLMVAFAEASGVPSFKEFAYRFRRGDHALNLFRRHGIIMEFDEDGKVLRTFQSPDGRTCDLSQVSEHEGYLYLGSFVNDYLGRLKL